jgi:mRNA deadenylase 3'-5' endonuclease subunit Ccr4
MIESIIRQIANGSMRSSENTTSYTETNATKSDAHSTKNNAVTSYSNRNKTVHPVLYAI